MNTALYLYVTLDSVDFILEKRLLINGKAKKDNPLVGWILLKPRYNLIQIFWLFRKNWQPLEVLEINSNITSH